MPMIEILNDTCKGCLLCIPACPYELMQNTKAKINIRGLYPVAYIDPEGKCTGCRLCAIVCPDVAIRVYKEPRKKSA
ncbi:MAG: hypothetical protein A2Y63_04985 [Candidatus Riflebacteria bacterium RBG_13_59_9]|nr:MAG: hypothetical protein A2Y63_04985 [Candidatus Riflebacteria bacterium RBG_13_59_9]